MATRTDQSPLSNSLTLWSTVLLILAAALLGAASSLTADTSKKFLAVSTDWVGFTILITQSLLAVLSGGALVKAVNDLLAGRVPPIRVGAVAFIAAGILLIASFSLVKALPALARW